MEKEMITLTCSNCGKELQVPAELEEFSCLYCGEKLKMAELLPAEAADPADLADVREHLIDCIREFPNYYKNFNRKKYASSFQTYQYGIEETFQAMNRYICAQSAQRDRLLDAFVEQFLQDWETFHHQQKSGKAAVEKQMFINKMTLAWYTVPAIRALELPISEDYTERLQKAFVAAYPKNPFNVGTYAEIAGGFRKHGICFITTAVCSYEGKPDDCAELTAFRAFRDGWLSETASGRRLVEEYYEIAPAVVHAIDFCDDRDLQYNRLRSDYLTPCYEALCHDDPETCRRTYIRMVEDLKARYFLQ